MAHIVITGANRGMGLALSEHYADRGNDVTAICRTASAEIEAVADTVIDGVDLTHPEGRARVADAIDDRKIDILLNVAGIMLWETLEELDLDLIRTQIEINALAPLALTHLLLDRLPPGSKIVFWTSRLGSLADNESGKGYGYRMSKTALNMAAKTLSVDLRSRQIAVGILHPGSVKTSLNKLGGEIEIVDAVKGLTAQIETLSMATSGQYRHQNGDILPW